MVIGDDIQSFQAPLCKGSSAAGGEGLFFATLQPLRGFRTRLGDACKCASHTRKSLPPLRGPPPLTQGRHIQTRLGDACKHAPHTCKSLQPLRGFRTRLGDACKRASHTRKSLYTREPFLINRGSAAPLLFDFLSYPFSPRSGLFRGENA